MGCDGLQEPDTVHPPPPPNWGILTKIAGGFFWGVATGCVFSSEGCTAVRYVCQRKGGPFVGENVRKPLPGCRSRAETGPVRTGKSGRDANEEEENAPASCGILPGWTPPPPLVLCVCVVRLLLLVSVLASVHFSD